MDSNTYVVYEMDENAIRNGETDITVPEGITEISGGAFDIYNGSNLIDRLSLMLIDRPYYVTQWKKKLSRTQIVKKTFPPGVRSLQEKAEYMYVKDISERLLKLNLPASLETVHSTSFPIFLEEINVDEENKSYKSVNGVLFSSDGKKLIRYPGFCKEKEYAVPEGVEVISEGAFCNSIIDKVTMPESLKELETKSFVGAYIGTLSIKEGLSAIRSNSFNDCIIREIHLPGTISLIEDYAFRGISGLTDFTCKSDNISVGKGIFEKSNFDDVGWWCFSEIPAATFINCNLGNISIPDGVVSVGMYAFAGCYKAGSVKIPETVTTIDAFAFDEGASFSAPVEMPKHLYKYAFRMPARSPINGKNKRYIWEQAMQLCDEEISERTDVLEKQREALETFRTKIKPFQKSLKKETDEQIEYISNLIENSRQ